MMRKVGYESHKGFKKYMQIHDEVVITNEIIFF